MLYYVYCLIINSVFVHSKRTGKARNRYLEQLHHVQFMLLIIECTNGTKMNCKM